MIFSWTLPRDGTQKTGYIQYKLWVNGIEPKKWTKVTLTGATLMPTSYTLPIDVTKYNPSTSDTLNRITWEVWMKGYTPWAGCYYFDQPAKATKVSVSGDTFSWSSDYANDVTSGKWFRDVEYQAVVTNSKAQPEWTALTIDTGTGQGTGSQTYSDPAGYRHFRCRTRSIAGNSMWSWIYKSHGVPEKVANVQGVLSQNRVTVSFDNPNEDSDDAIVYYMVAVPDAGYVPPAGGSWTQATSIKMEKKIVNQVINSAWQSHYSTTFNITAPVDDQALWIRVDITNSPNTTTGDVIYVGNGGISAPTITNFSIDTAAKTVTFDYTNTSNVSGVTVVCVASSVGELPVISQTSTRIVCSYAALEGTVVNFGIYAKYGDKAISDIIWQTIDISLPQAPTGLTVVKVPDESGKVRVSWTNQWAAATRMEISWSDDKDAWECNLEPDTYEVSAAATTYLIAGLRSGSVYYFRVRGIEASDDGIADDVYGPYNSGLVSVDLTETPDAPAVWVDSATITEGGSVTVRWAYVSNDGTDQANAEIYLDNVKVYDVTGEAQSYTFLSEWATNTTHTIKVRTVSTSGRISNQSSAVSVTVAKALTLSVSTSLTGGDTLDAMPLTITTTGAGYGGQIAVSITRNGAFVAGRPDNDTDDGFDGETIYTRTFTGNLTSYDIDADGLVGRLDDGCAYLLTVALADGLGQSTSTVIPFEVAWSHQPDIPTATITNRADGLVQIEVDEPDSYVSGDYCQIYRLSADKPELIVDLGEYGEEYIDPYPASSGGYRVVNVTANGDYIAGDYPAWIDYAHTQTVDDMIIDFNGQQLLLPYNLTLSTSWEKDFERTKYLNGSVQGDWNRAVTVDGDVSTVTIETDDARIDQLRALAAFPGVCHVRTPDGASYTADVQVKQSGEYSSALVSFDLTIKRVDAPAPEGMLLTDWEDNQ